MDDVIKLVTISYTVDSVGNQIEQKTERTVMCKVLSAGRSEFYQAAQAELHPDYIFRLSNFADYQGEKELVYTDWTNTAKTFDVIRTYRPEGSDTLEITAQERIADYV